MDKEKTRELIASELDDRGTMGDVRRLRAQNGPPEAPGEPQKKKGTEGSAILKGSSTPLSELEAALLDAVIWRTTSIEKDKLLLNYESKEIDKMRDDLIGRIIRRLKLDTSKVSFDINSETKSIVFK